MWFLTWHGGCSFKPDAQMSGSTERYDLNPKCPAKGTECLKLGKINHFEKICRTAKLVLGLNTGIQRLTKSMKALTTLMTWIETACPSTDILAGDKESFCQPQTLTPWKVTNVVMSNYFPKFDQFDPGLWIKLRSYLCGGFDTGIVVMPQKKNFHHVDK